MTPNSAVNQTTGKLRLPAPSLAGTSRKRVALYLQCYAKE